MAFELGHGGSLRTILLSSALVVGCAMHDRGEGAPVVLRHEGHDHGAQPAARPTQPAGTAVPVDCPNTYDALQATIFDSATYGCASADCHGKAGGHIDLRKGFSYDSLLGLAPQGEDHEHDHDHDADPGHDEAGHTHAEGDDHGHALVLPDFDVLHHEGEEHGEAGHHDGEGHHDEGHAHGAHVIAGKPEQSVLYDSLRAKVEGIPTKLGGTPMPLGADPISRDQLEAVELWIAAGAPRTGFVAGTEGLCVKAPSTGR